jgi:hypothetical protein
LNATQPGLRYGMEDVERELPLHRVTERYAVPVIRYSTAIDFHAVPRGGFRHRVTRMEEHILMINRHIYWRRMEDEAVARAALVSYRRAAMRQLRMPDHRVARPHCQLAARQFQLGATVGDRFQPFTVLREPVARVLSLYRFLRSGDPYEVRRLGLRPDFTLNEFLGSSNAELYGQINNGMVRMLSGDPRLDDPGDAGFWNMDGQPDVLRSTVANLEWIDFGLSEEMPATLALALARWAVPYRLREYHEIIKLNTMDLALYHRARTMFSACTRVSPNGVSPEGWNLLSMFAPKMNLITHLPQSRSTW